MTYKMKRMKVGIRDYPQYRYYAWFNTDKGDYVIYSRDGKRYYVQDTKTSKLMNLRDEPFKNPTEAKEYLKYRLAHANVFGV